MAYESEREKKFLWEPIQNPTFVNGPLLILLQLRKRGRNVWQIRSLGACVCPSANHPVYPLGPKSVGMPVFLNDERSKMLNETLNRLLVVTRLMPPGNA